MEDNVFSPLQEVEPGQSHDLIFIHTRLSVKGKGVERPFPGHPGVTNTIDQASFLTIPQLLSEQITDDILDRAAALDQGNLLLHNPGHSFKLQLIDESVDFIVHDRSKKSPAVLSRIIFSSLAGS
jgi:hypothetical protein